MAATINSITLEPCDDFRPVIGPDAMAALTAAFKRWVDSGKPDYIPPAPEEE